MKKLLNFIFVFYLFGCKNLAYNKVNNDIHPTQRNKDILNSVCSRTFPAPSPTYIEGKTIIKTDTFSKIDTLTIREDSILTKYVIKTNTVTVERTKTDTLRISNQYTEAALKDKIEALKDENQRLEIELGMNTKRLNKLRIIVGIGILLLIGSILIRYGRPL